MKIKKLIVRKTKPSEEVIREIQFKEKGLNLIIDDTPESLRESGNSVGKSTAIKIIYLCLGAKSVRELYYDSDTSSENVVVKDFLEEYKVQAELILIDENKREYSIKRDLFLRGKKYIFDEPYSDQDFWFELKKIIFGLKEPRPTFRQLIPKFVRVENTAEERMIKFLRRAVILLFVFVLGVAGSSFLHYTQTTDDRSDMNDPVFPEVIP